MKEIIGEYLQILNDYIKFEERDGNIFCKPIEVEELSTVLDSFWISEYDKLIEKIRSFDGIKTMNYGIIPENLEVYIKRSSLYSDLIIFDAPLDSYTLKSNFKNNKVTAQESEYLYYTLSKINKFKDWIDEEIVTLVPHSFFQKNNQYRNYAKTLVEDDLQDENIRNVLDNKYKEYGGLLYPLENKDLYDFGFVGKLNDNLMTTGILKSNLIADQEIYWNLLMCKLEKDNKLLGNDSLSLAALNKVNVKFLDNVTLDFALKLRKEGYLSELRSYFRETFKEIEKTPDKSDFNDLVNNYSTEIVDKVKMHEREWKNIKKEASEKIGVKGGLALSNGAIGGTATYGLGIPAWIGFLGGVLLSSNYTIKDIVDEYLEFRRNRRELQINPIHLLYELKTG